MVEKANTLINLGRYSDAVKLINENIGNSDNDELLYEMLVNCYFHLNDMQHLKSVLDNALSLYPENDLLIYFMSCYYSDITDYNQALDYINKAIELENQNPYYYGQQAKIYLRKNEESSCKMSIFKGRELDPENLDIIIVSAAYHLVFTNDKNRALYHIYRGLELEPENTHLLSLKARLIVDDKELVAEAEENALYSLQEDPNNEFARETLLEILKHKNGFLRFFVSKAFNRYKIEWSAGKIIIFIVLWKASIFWGSLFIIYMFVTWYGGVFFNSVMRLDSKYKYLLNKQNIYQSNIFLGFHLLTIISFIISYFTGGLQNIHGYIIFLLYLMFLAISLFEISTKNGQWQFYVYATLTTIVLLFQLNNSINMTLFSLFFLVFYGVFFTLNILFK